MGIDWSYWAWFGPGMFFTGLSAYWLVMNIRSHWDNEMRGKQFNPVVAPGERALLLMFFAGIVGTILTLTIPRPDILWADPYDNPWIIIHLTHATLWTMISIVSFLFFLGQRHIKDEDENRTMVLVVFTVMIFLFQILMEGAIGLPGNAEEGSGFDHRSHVHDAVILQMRTITIPWCLSMIAEIFLEHKIFVFFRILMPGCLAAWFFFLASMFTTEWCDDLDNPESPHCDAKSQAVSIHIARYMLPRIILLGIFFLSIIWFRYIPKRIIVWLLPKDQVVGVPESRIGSSSTDAHRHQRLGGSNARRGARKQPTVRTDDSEMQHYGLNDDDDGEVITFDQNARQGASVGNGSGTKFDNDGWVSMNDTEPVTTLDV